MAEVEEAAEVAERFTRVDGPIQVILRARASAPSSKPMASKLNKVCLRGCTVP